MSKQNERAPRAVRNKETGDELQGPPRRLTKPSMIRQQKKKDAEPARIIAYDYETTRIAEGTPRPLYITAFGVDPPMHYESAIDSLQHLQDILVNNFLTEENLNCKFVAWNGNNFDAYFTAAALVTHPGYVMRPYLTQSKSLRGIRVLRREDIDVDRAPSWEFLDGIAMLGLVGVKLSKLLDTFAPNLPKLEGVIDFEREEFDSTNAEHRAYAMRDSQGLEFAMRRAQMILLHNFNQPLTVTMGGACIRILKANIPLDVTVRPLDDSLNAIVRRYVMRGGYCYCVRRFEGPVWKYDLNQAYASAMREAWLPSERVMKSTPKPNHLARCYLVRLEAWKPDNIVPFYYRTHEGDRIRAVFGTDHIAETWITSSEHKQLIAEGWRIEVRESFAWEDAFRLSEYVDKLESKRMTCEGGPSGPEGTIFKNVGNHSYGKVLEQLEPVEYVIAGEAPPGFVPTYANDDADAVEHIFERKLEDVRAKDYHQPHIGAFITAHVRMVVRRAALLSPESWLYADTDCVVFASDVTAKLDIDAKRYGAWKIEEAGTVFQIIAKKVYANTATGKGSAKGLHVRKVTPTQFSEWLAGTPPVQEQIQRNNFLSVMEGAEMYRVQRRSGTAVGATPPATSSGVSSRVTIEKTTIKK